MLPIILRHLIGEQRPSGPQSCSDLESDSSQQPCTLHGKPAYPYTLLSVRRPVPPPLLLLPVVTEYIPSLSNKSRLRVSCELWFQVSYVETLLQTHVSSHCSVQNFRLLSRQVESKLLCCLTFDARYVDGDRDINLNIRDNKLINVRLIRRLLTPSKSFWTRI